MELGMCPTDCRDVVCGAGSSPPDGSGAVADAVVSSSAPLREELGETLDQQGICATTPQRDARGADPSLSAREAMEEAFDQQGVSSDLLRAWVVTEHRLFSGSGESALPPAARTAAFRFFGEVMNLSRKTWFQAVALVDAYYARASGGSDTASLPSLCLAAVMVLAKVGDSATAFDGVVLSHYTSYLAKSLQSLGFSASVGTSETVADMEVKLLEGMSWQINFPSVESWLSVFGKRLNLLLGGRFSHCLEGVHRQCITHAQLLLVSQASMAEVPARRIACGLLCTILVSAQLLPVKTLCPPTASSETWEMLDSHCNPQGVTLKPVLSTSQLERFVLLLEIATGFEFSQLQQDYLVVASLPKQGGSTPTTS